jgi:hypothetical protein
MTKWLMVAVGIVLLAVGAVWTLQGVGVLTGSPMTGQQVWTVIGLLAAIAGLVLAVAGFRRARVR